MTAEIGPEDVLEFYRRGVFPMAETRDAATVFLVDPEERGVIPLDSFHVPRRLARTVRTSRLQVTCNRSFQRVMELCAEPMPDRPETWINGDILRLYVELHRMGYAHSIECWEGEALLGGLYGVSVGAAFFGESMFSRTTDASKIALVHLAARLKAGRYLLLDAQFTTEHLSQFGAIAVPRAEFRRRLRLALAQHGDFAAAPDPMSGDQALQLIAQTS